MTCFHHKVVALCLLLAACGASKPSDQQCQQALQHLADLAEKGPDKVPHDTYVAQNKADFLRSCHAATKAKVECWMKMTDLGGEAWARCK